MMTLTLEELKKQLPPDVIQILQEQASKANTEPDAYIERLAALFARQFAQSPYFKVREAKLGWDLEQFSLKDFARFVRDEADDLAFDLQLAALLEPDATPKQRAEAFRAWARLPRRKASLLSDEAVSRESIYEESL